MRSRILEVDELNKFILEINLYVSKNAKKLTGRNNKGRDFIDKALLIIGDSLNNESQKQIFQGLRKEYISALIKGDEAELQEFTYDTECDIKRFFNDMGNHLYQLPQGFFQKIDTFFKFRGTNSGEINLKSSLKKIFARPDNLYNKYQVRVACLRSLPPEILIKIFKYCDNKGLKSFAMSCWAFYIFTNRVVNKEPLTSGLRAFSDNDLSISNFSILIDSEFGSLNWPHLCNLFWPHQGQVSLHPF